MSASASEEISATGPEPKVVLRDLQPLLKNSLGDQVIVTSYKTESLLPKGENYGSTILKVEATIKRSQNAPEEHLHLVAKMITASEFSRKHMNVTLVFKKEIYIFGKLMMVYRTLEQQAGIPDSELIDVVPKLYGARLSMNPDSDEADEDVVILAENLKTSGYTIMDRKKGLDLDHSKLAIKELARYHALGIVCKHRNSEFFKTAMDFLSGNLLKHENELDYTIDLTKQNLYSDPRIKIYEDRINKIFEKGWGGVFAKSPDNIWLSITHGDFWTNNMMFYHDENGKPDKIKFVDFQLTAYNTCLRDILYFLTNSCSLLVMTNSLEEILDTYYNSFISTLKRMNFDRSEYTRANFDMQIKSEARGVLFLTILALKFITLDVTDDFEMEDMVRDVMNKEINVHFKERAYGTIKMYLAKNWI